MKKYIIILILLLGSCASQNLETKNIKSDDIFELESQADQKYSIEAEELILQSNSIQKQANVQKSNTPEEYKAIEKKEEVTYGSIRYENTIISFKTLPSVNDSSKDQGTSGYISKGANGLNRKELRDVYINGKYSHIQTVKESYIISNTIDEQKWIGTKELSPTEDELEEINYIFYKTYDSFDTCNFEANELARINSKKGWLSTMCDGPNLYYTLRD